VQLMRKSLSTREGTLAFAGLAGVLALAVLLVFMNGYKKSVDDGSQPVTVLVARETLPKGTPGDVLAQKGMFQATGLKREQVKEGAITDPASLRGLVAVHDLVRGQQLTTADFVRPGNGVLSRLDAGQRAVTIPLDSAHGALANVRTGDHVDVYAGFEIEPGGTGRSHPVLRELLQDVVVLEAPGEDKQSGLGGGSQTKNLVLQVDAHRAPELAFASDNGKLWIALRPPAGARPTVPSLVTLDRLLLGMPPIPVDRSLAKKRGLIAKVYQGDVR
jgi:Flp pilus assembly protein CpaB